MLWALVASGALLTAATSVVAQQSGAQAPPGAGVWSAKVLPKPPTTQRVMATAFRVSGDEARTRIEIDVSKPIVASVFLLDDPFRVIVDVANLEFLLPAGSGTRPTGLVNAYRYGQFDAGRSRIVIDLSAPVKIENALSQPPAGKSPGLLRFDLVRVSASEFLAMRGPADPTPESAQTPPPPGPSLRAGRHDQPQPDVKAAAPKKTRPVVMLDPGHGGIDPGAVAAAGILEKSITLAVALQVRNLLLQSSRLDVRMTRQNDTFISLDQRINISRQHNADLFVSIHADAIAETDLAQAVRGATVYILSDRASDETARRLAEKENAADVLAGLSSVPSSAEEQVRNILLDLVQRETANYAIAFRNLLVANMRGKVPLARDPLRSAAFKVLKQSETPAVLVELGYMSNAEDLARLGKAEGQRQLAVSIAHAIESYFAQRAR